MKLKLLRFVLGAKCRTSHLRTPSRCPCLPLSPVAVGRSKGTPSEGTEPDRMGGEGRPSIAPGSRSRRGEGQPGRHTCSPKSAAREKAGLLLAWPSALDCCFLLIRQRTDCPDFSYPPSVWGSKLGFVCMFVYRTENELVCVWKRECIYVCVCVCMRDCVCMC